MSEKNNGTTSRTTGRTTTGPTYWRSLSEFHDEPEFRDLLASCEARLEAQGSLGRRLQGVREKLERAVRIEESARRRRERWSGRSRRRGARSG